MNYISIFPIIWTVICLIITYPLCNKNERSIIYQDFKRWASYREIKITKWSFISLFAESKEFRSVVYYRLRNRYRLLPSVFLKGQDSCHICGRKIDGGLLLIHGNSTIINSKYVGSNCTFFQNVTIGYSKGHTPIIGNNCVFGCGSIVLGNVEIGNNVIVGAGAVVTHNVPDDSVVIGNPGRIYAKKFEGEILDYV